MAPVPSQLDPAEECQLLSQAREDAGAFQVLYEHYLPRVFAYVGYRVGGLPDTEDVVSSIFTKVVAGLGRFEPRGEGSFAAWLFRIAHDEVVDYYRERRREPASVPLDELPDLATSALLPFDVAEQKEKLAHLRRLIAQLSPRRQEIVTLKFSGGLRNCEIAQVLGIDERTVASHLCRALDDLHRLYLQTFPAEDEVTHA